MKSDYPSYLVDANVIVYAHDPRDEEKRQRAVEVLNRLAVAEVGAISVQGLAEFLSACSRKLRGYVTVDELIAQVERWMWSFAILDLTPAVVLDAARGMRDHQFSYWDAQVWAAARLSQIPVVLSEDFIDGRAVEGVKFVNPFKPDFDVASLGA